MPYKNIFLYEGQRLGTAMCVEDDPFKALREGEKKAEQISRILAAQVKGVKPTDIEIQCWWYDPQYTMFPELFPKESMQVAKNSKRGTLASLKVG